MEFFGIAGKGQDREGAGKFRLKSLGRVRMKLWYYDIVRDI
jgi:hypothetical protein